MTFPPPRLVCRFRVPDRLRLLLLCDHPDLYGEFPVDTVRGARDGAQLRNLLGPQPAPQKADLKPTQLEDVIDCLLRR